MTTFLLALILIAFAAYMGEMRIYWLAVMLGIGGGFLVGVSL